MTFEGDASFLRCYSLTDDSVETSSGGAISNNVPGVIHFMGNLTMENNEAEVRTSFPWRGSRIRILVQSIPSDNGNSVRLRKAFNNASLKLTTWGITIVIEVHRYFLLLMFFRTAARASEACYRGRHA